MARRKVSKAEKVALTQAIIRYGFTDVVRASTHLCMHVAYIREKGHPAETLADLRTWWKQSERSADREAAAWRKVTGNSGADVIEVALKVSEALDEAVKVPVRGAETLEFFDWIPVAA